MKKWYTKFFAATMALLILQLQLHAGVTNTETETTSNNAEIEIYEAFSDIDGLIAYLDENEEVSYSELQENHNSLIENVSTSAAIAMSMQEADAPPLMSSFWWGCIFNWVGVIVVYVTTDSNKEYTKGAWTGCLVSTGCSALSWVAYYIYVIAVLGGIGYY